MASAEKFRGPRTGKTEQERAVIRAGAARFRDALEAAEKRKKETSGPP